MTDYPDFLFLTITNTHANTSLQTSFHNMLKSIANLTISEENLMCVKSVALPHSAVGNVSGYRCVSDCNSRGREFDPGPVPYFRGD